MTETIQNMLSKKAESQKSGLVEYVGTVEAYDKWAEVYDTDGNFLQRLDTIELRVLLPRFLDAVKSRFKSTEQLKLVDLGCGTGRNTVQLLKTLSKYKENEDTDQSHDGKTSATQIEVIGVDASPGMLEVAQKTVQSAFTQNESQSAEVSLGVFDLLKPISDGNRLPTPLQQTGAAGVISTLVLEHIPLREFFEAASAMMQPGGYLLITNMHADMGALSQAGFTDPQTGVKIRPTSYCHSTAEVLAAATGAGFHIKNLIGEKGGNAVLERAVDENLGDILGARAKKWVGINVWFGVCFSKI
ncbi:methyltransferase [Penicillium angulare]|uniref:methyltransferase n=1 Tax=Penicillium angulare TaxID=116970 RepID=UPI0025419679|nr:methyltransferase [Penicillium angulare]KAJ5291691.1 methyltransferase [Penicillium angulare]